VRGKGKNEGKRRKRGEGREMEGRKGGNLNACI
jgi:hypothetical protein